MDVMPTLNNVISVIKNKTMGTREDEESVSAASKAENKQKEGTLKQYQKDEKIKIRKDKKHAKKLKNMNTEELLNMMNGSRPPAYNDAFSSAPVEYESYMAEFGIKYILASYRINVDLKIRAPKPLTDETMMSLISGSLERYSGLESMNGFANLIFIMSLRRCEIHGTPSNYQTVYRLKFEKVMKFAANKNIIGETHDIPANIKYEMCLFNDKRIYVDFEMSIKPASPVKAIELMEAITSDDLEILKTYGMEIGGAKQDRIAMWPLHKATDCCDDFPELPDDEDFYGLE